MRNTYRWALVASLLIVPACSAPQADSTWQTMTLSSKPELVEVSDGDGIREHGEGMVYEAVLKDQNGTAVGQLLGMHTIIDIPGKDAVGDPNAEERITLMSMVFGEEDEIEIQGANTYPMGEQVMRPDTPQYRAIIGGTGRYKGIRGQLKTTRGADGTHTHTLEYRLD